MRGAVPEIPDRSPLPKLPQWFGHSYRFPKSFVDVCPVHASTEPVLSLSKGSLFLQIK
jgi:hypothetical protein